MSEDVYWTFAHNPPHLFVSGASYMITASTYQKRPHIHSDERKTQWTKALRFVLDKEGWLLVAGVVLSNHYHLLLRAPDTGAQRLSAMIASLHRFTARQWNAADHTPGRSVWWNYWDTCLTNEASYFARVNYIHYNPVKHGLVSRPELYPFSTYRMWLESWEPQLRHIEQGYPFDVVSAYDDF